MEGSVINQICASMDSFFDTEKKIGDYIVRNPKNVVDMTVGELAKECGLEMPGEANVKKVYDKGMEAGMGSDDWRSTFKLVRGH